MILGGGKKRLGTSFHETFALNRPAMSQVLATAAKTPELMTFEGLRSTTNLGRNYVKAMPRYCYGAGLLDGENAPTAFGKVALERDPALQRPETQWLMHFFLSLDGGPGPRFWHDLVTRHLRVGSTVTADQVAEWISTSISKSGDRELAARTLKDSARVFLRTYSRVDGLSQIGLVDEVKHAGTLYEINSPSRPGASVILAALAYLWARRWPVHATANLEDVTQALGEIFMVGHQQLLDTLRELQRRGALELWRVAPPYQVAATFADGQQVWAQLYDS